MKFLVVSWTIKENVYKELKCFCRSQWQPKVNLKDLLMMWSVFKKIAWFLEKNLKKILPKMTNWVSSNNKRLCFRRKKSKKHKIFRKFKWKKQHLRGHSKTKKLSTPKLRVVSTWKEMISNNTLPIWEVRIKSIKKWKRFYKKLNLKWLYWTGLRNFCRVVLQILVILWPTWRKLKVFLDIHKLKTKFKESQIQRNF